MLLIHNTNIIADHLNYRK